MKNFKKIDLEGFVLKLEDRRTKEISKDFIVLEGDDLHNKEHRIDSYYNH